jgi:hypothetical protein
MAMPAKCGPRASRHARLPREDDGGWRASRGGAAFYRMRDSVVPGGGGDLARLRARQQRVGNRCAKGGLGIATGHFDARGGIRDTNELEMGDNKKRGAQWPLPPNLYS